MSGNHKETYLKEIIVYIEHMIIVILRETMRGSYIGCVDEATGYRYNAYRNDDENTKWFEYGNLIQRYVDRREPCPGRFQ